MTLAAHSVSRVSRTRDRLDVSLSLVASTVYTVHNFARFEVFMEVTMKNVFFWDIKTQFVLHMRHITSTLQSPAS
jgi:hypothetical protein